MIYNACKVLKMISEVPSPSKMYISRDNIRNVSKFCTSTCIYTRVCEHKIIMNTFIVYFNKNSP